MNKLKRFLFLFIAVLLTVAIAILPQAAAMLQDRAIHGQAQYGDIRSVRLSLGERAEERPGSMMEKLSILRGHSLYSISEDEAAMTQDEVLAAIDNALAPYYENGLMYHDWDDAGKSLTPYISFGSDNTYCIFWEVSFSGYGSEYYSLNLYIDDETGKLLFIHYQADSLEFSDEDRYLLIGLLEKIYFDALEIGLTADDRESMGLAEDISSDAANTTAMRYLLEDTKYGEFIIEICIHRQGFYIYLPM